MKKSGITLTQCTACVFFGAHTYTCDYYLLTGIRRSCPPGGGCLRFAEAEAADVCGTRI